MEGLGSVASIIAAIDLSAKVTRLCKQYCSTVKNAKYDIERLQGELIRLKTVLEDAQRLLESPKGGRLQTSQLLRDELRGCLSLLVELEKKLGREFNLGPAHKVMRSFGVRALKWPFFTKDVDRTIETLKGYRDTFSTALNIDQTAQVLGINQTLLLSKLLIAEDATFDSHADEHDARCHPETRITVLQDIMRWADDPQGESIFWLNGMAGTGKSTISRTVAQSFADKGDLGASFFFKRGELNRDDATRLFKTITAQLIAKDSSLATHVIAAIEADPAITGKSLREQFEKFILEPLRKKPLGNLKGDPDEVKQIVFVIDALDECRREDDIKVVLHLLSQPQALSSVRLRAFVTSRPELPIRLGFNGIKGSYQDLVLHEIPKTVIEHDIGVFLNYKLIKIRDNYNSLSCSERHLPLDWPGPEIVKTLVQMAIPLFIFAATICRFIEDQAWCDPASQLAKVLEYQSRTQQSEIDKLDATYLPILNHLLKDAGAARNSLVDEFRTVVGSIVLLAEPLSISSLAHLLDIPGSVIYRRLSSLYSVLSEPISPESPVRMFHLSFRDFLVDPGKQGTNPLWVDESATHERIATRCLELMCSGDHLREGVCTLKMPGTACADVEPAVIDVALSSPVRYACLHWVYHLERSNSRISDDHQAYSFLKIHFLHWLEALSLLGSVSESISMINTLQALIVPDMRAAALSAFLHDAARFILNCHSTIALRPLQVYSSAIIFAPENSVVRNIFKNSIPGWISMLPNVDPEWNACLQTFKVDGGWVNAVAFSPDSKTLASASRDGSIWVWDSGTGSEIHKLEGHGDCVNTLIFSSEGNTLASGSNDNTVRIWDPVTGNEKLELKGHGGWVKAVAFSPDSKTLASAAYDRTIRLWDAVTGTESRILVGHSDHAKAVAFSPDGKILVSSSRDGTIRLWDPAIGNEIQRLEGHSGPINAVAFSPDGKTVASSSDDRTIMLWNSETGKVNQRLEGHTNFVSSVAFSPDGKTLASASKDFTVRLWDLIGGKQQGLEGHNGPVNDVAFSKDSRTLASASNDGTVRLWDPATAEQKPRLQGHSRQVNAVAFSLDGKTLASASSDNTIRLWDPEIGIEKKIINGHSGWVNALTFSPNNKTFASGSSDCTVRLWDLTTGDEINRLKDHTTWVSAVAFSPNGKTLASASCDGIIRLWDPVTRIEKKRLEGHSGYVKAIAFSPDCRILASSSDDGTIRLWDPTTGDEKKMLKIDDPPASLSFSEDSCHLRTNPGLLSLNSDSPNTIYYDKPSDNAFYISEDRVIWNEKEVLWLLQSHRPSCVALYGNTLALGHASGMVTFIQFAPDRIVPRNGD